MLNLGEKELSRHPNEQFSKWESEVYECKMRGHSSVRSRALGKGQEGKTEVRNAAADG